MKLLKKLDAMRPPGMSRADWIRRANLAESTWYRWQSGQTSPTLEILERLARVVGSSIDCKPAEIGRLRGK